MVIYFRGAKANSYLKETDRNGNIILHTYNKDGNIMSKRAQDSYESEVYVYNTDGSVKLAASNSSVTGFTYDKMGNVLSETRNGDIIKTYTYNKNNQVETIQNRNNDIITYGYDQEGRIDRVLFNNNEKASYSFNTNNTINTVSNNNGVTSSYTYTGNMEVETLVIKDAQNNYIHDYVYTYDNTGNLIHRQDGIKTESYTYNPDSQISNVQYENGIQETYTYDMSGNRLSKITDGVETGYVYDSRNRLLSTTTEDFTTLYTYDNNGNTLTVSDGTVYSYNKFNQNTEILLPDGGIQKNIYDVSGLRIALVENGEWSEYTYDRGNIIFEEKGLDNNYTSYVRGYNLISKETDTASFFYELNIHGDVTGITDINGATVNTYIYDVFGNILDETTGIDNMFMYASEQYDKLSGNYYLRARYYNSVIGRFTQEDTFRGDGLNLYAYVANNPLRFIDPSGHWREPIKDIFDDIFSPANDVCEFLAYNMEDAVMGVSSAFNLGIKLEFEDTYQILLVDMLGLGKVTIEIGIGESLVSVGAHIKIMTTELAELYLYFHGDCDLVPKWEWPPIDIDVESGIAASTDSYNLYASMKYIFEEGDAEVNSIGKIRQSLVLQSKLTDPEMSVGFTLEIDPLRVAEVAALVVATQGALAGGLSPALAAKFAAFSGLLQQLVPAFNNR
jgi:RHS repeat-associated protein